MQSALIKLDNKGGILEISLNRAQRKNALNQEMYTVLGEAITSASAPNSGVKSIILTGSEGCFTSGNDLIDFAGVASMPDLENLAAQFMQAVLNCPIPMIVAIEGVAIGIGTTLLLHSDLCYASPNAKFSLPFTKLGLCPEYASSFLLPQLVGRAKAAEWLLLGEEFGAEEAKELGLINGVVDKPLEKAREQSAKLIKQPPLALRQTKALLKSALHAQIQQVMENENDVFVESLKGPEFGEAANAFFEKRPANFSKL